MGNDITQPLTLWRGSHRAGSGKGCAMNVISWENGDKTITDYPECSDRMLARIVQGVNDSLSQEDGSLTPEDSMRVLDLGHATVGTGYHGLSDLELKRVYVRLAAYAARKVLHLDRSGTALPAIVAAETWAFDPTDRNRAAVDAAVDAADAAHAAYPAYAAAYAATVTTAADAVIYAAAACAVAADDAADDAAACAVAGRPREELAAELIAMFKYMTGSSADMKPLPVSLENAIAQMCEVRL